MEQYIPSNLTLIILIIIIILGVNGSSALIDIVKKYIRVFKKIREPEEEIVEPEPKPNKDTVSPPPPPTVEESTPKTSTINDKVKKEKRERKAKESQKRIEEQHRQRQLEKEEAIRKREEVKAKSVPAKKEIITSNPKTPTKIITKKSREKEVLPPVTKPKEKPIQQKCYVNYTSHLQETKQIYPLLKIPQKGCIVRSYRIGASKRREYKEASFQQTISNYFSKHFKVTGNIRLNTGEKTRPYEPDIALVDEISNLNVRIDIEIDEPYAGIKRNPTHCIGDDTSRDIFFRDRGWIVIRFSEEQVHKKELSCIKYIFKVVQSIYTNIPALSDLEHIEELPTQKQWDVVQAQKWEKNNYRERYLEHVFNPLLPDEETTERGLTKQEIKEENEVKPTLLGEVETEELSGYNKGNISGRDKRIEFYPEPHRYTIDKVPVPSVSTVVSKFFPEFDAYYRAANLKPSNPLYGYSVDRANEKSFM